MRLGEGGRGRGKGRGLWGGVGTRGGSRWGFGCGGMRRWGRLLRSFVGRRSVGERFEGIAGFLLSIPRILLGRMVLLRGLVRFFRCNSGWFRGRSRFRQ